MFQWKCPSFCQWISFMSYQLNQNTNCAFTWGVDIFFLGLFHKAFHHLRTWLKHYDQLRVCSRPSPYHFLWAHCIMDRNSTYFQIFCYTTRFYGDNFPTFRTSPKPSLLWKPKKKNCPYGAWPPVWICEKNMSAKAANSFILLCNIWAFRFLFYFISFHLAFLLWFKKKKIDQTLLTSY